MASLRAHPAPAAPAVAPADALSHWLLTGPAQMVAGPHAGGVAGCVDADGRARYVYPEVTGYFLHWLAWQSAASTNAASAGELRRRAGAAQGWLLRWISGDVPPPTRIHLAASGADWRNEAVFCFDIAMVLRGLAAAAAERLVEPEPAVIAGLVAQLRTLVGADGAFDAYAPREHRTVLPQRWSTRRGGFRAKAAAGVIVAAETLRGIPPDIVAAAEATFEDSLRAAVDAPHDEVHPLLYTFEGILNLPEHPRFAGMLPHLAIQMNALLAVAREAGGVPEFLAQAPSTEPRARFDVLAQTLRAGHWLERHRPHDPPDRVGLTRLRHALIERIKPNGAIPFSTGAEAALDNVWATMFAEQALRLTEPGRVGRPRVDSARLLV
jgi:hypothetical protein